MLQLDICKAEVMLLPLPVPAIGIASYSMWNPSPFASLLQARYLVQMHLHQMPDPYPMFRNGEHQDFELTPDKKKNPLSSYEGKAK